MGHPVCGLPEGRYIRVELDVGVVGEQRQAVIDGLCDENAVERVSMVRLEMFDGEDVLIGDGKNGNSILCQLIIQVGDGRGEVAEFAQPDLQAEFPEGRQREEEFMLL